MMVRGHGSLLNTLAPAAPPHSACCLPITCLSWFPLKALMGLRLCLHMVLEDTVDFIFTLAQSYSHPGSQKPHPGDGHSHLSLVYHKAQRPRVHAGPAVHAGLAVHAATATYACSSMCSDAESAQVMHLQPCMVYTCSALLLFIQC